MAAMLNAKCSFDASDRPSFTFGHPPPKDKLDTTTLDSTKTHPASHISLTSAPFQFGVTEEPFPSDVRPYVLHPASPDYCDKIEDEEPEEPFKPFQPIDHMRTIYSFGVDDVHIPELPKEWDDAFSTLLRDGVAICAPFNGDFSTESALHAPIPEGCNSIKAKIARCWNDVQTMLQQSDQQSDRYSLSREDACDKHLDTIQTLNPEHDDDRRLCEWLRQVVRCMKGLGWSFGWNVVLSELVNLRKSMKGLVTLHDSERDTFVTLNSHYVDRFKGIYTMVASGRVGHIVDGLRWGSILELGQDKTHLHTQMEGFFRSTSPVVCSIERKICKTVVDGLASTFCPTYLHLDGKAVQSSRLFPYLPSRWMATLGTASTIGRCSITDDTLPNVLAFYRALDTLGVTSHVKTDLMTWTPTAEAYQLLMNPLIQEAVEVISSAFFHQFLLSVDPSRLVGTRLIARDGEVGPSKRWSAHVLSIGYDTSTKETVSYVPTFEVKNGEGIRKTIRVTHFPLAPTIVGSQDEQSYLVPAFALAKTLQARTTYIKIWLERIGRVVEQYNDGTTSFQQCFNLWECSQTYTQLSKVQSVCTDAFIAEVERMACTTKAASFGAPYYKKYNELRYLLTRLGEQDTNGLSMPPPLDYPPSALVGRPRELGRPDSDTLCRLNEQKEMYHMFDNEMNTIEHRLRQMESERQPVYDALMTELNAWTRFLGVNTWTIAEMTPQDNSAAYGGLLSEKHLDYLKRQVACATKVGAAEWSLALAKITKFRSIWGDKLPPQDMLKTTVEKLAYDLNADLSYPPSGLKVEDALPKVIIPRVNYWTSYWKDVRTCAICCEHGPSLFKFCLSTETCCPMSAQICRSCTLNGLEEKLGNNGVTVHGIPCLMKHCDGHVPDAAIRTYLPEDKQQSYDRLRRDAVVDANPDASWCRTPGCQTNGMDSFLDTSVILRCGTCYALHCESCLEFAHPDESCEAYKDRTTDECLRTDHQTCPRCNVRIHRIDGCPHMQCSQCPNKTHFCYHCGREYLTRDEDAAKDAPDPEGMTSRCNSGGCFYKGIGNVEE